MAKQTITSGKAPIVWSTVEEAFSKINANKLDLEMSNFEFKSKIDGIKKMLSYKAEDSGIYLNIDLNFEELFLYSNVWEEDGSKLKSELDPTKLWLLEEGHCLSNQIASICNLRNKSISESQIIYKTGSLETMLRLAENGKGQTIIPHMLVDYLNDSTKKKIFKIPLNTPVREIALIYSENYNRKGIINALRDEILSVIPLEWISSNNKSVIPLNI